MSTDRLGMTVLSVSDCLDLLRSVEVGRLAAHGEFPEILPVNFVVDHGTVVFRTAPGTKLDALRDDEAVSFEADGYDPARGEAWSVVIKGFAEVLSDAYDVFEAVELPLFPWQAAPKPHFVRIAPVSITGRRFCVVARRPPDAATPASRAADE